MNISLSDHFTYKKLLRFTFPSIIMMILTSIYGVVDGVFVSNFVGSEAFASINIIMPFLMILGAIGFMTGSGGSALVALTFGTGNEKKAKEIFSLLVYVLIAVGFFFTVGGEILLAPMARLLGADEILLPYCVRYGRIILLALIPFMLQNVFQSFLVVAERPQLGLLITIASGLTNMILDAYFIAVLRLGVVGAAAATAISQSIGGLIPLLYFIFPNRSRLRLGRTHMDFSALLKTCTNGASEFMTNISMSIVNMLYNWQLMRLAGSDGVAVYGIIMYVDIIFMTLYLGYSLGSAPIVSFHYGAGNHAELKNLCRKSLVIISACGVILLTASQILAGPLVKIFANYDQELLEMTTWGFRIYAIAFMVRGMNVWGSSFFTALNNGAVSAAISFLRTFVFQIVIVLILPKLIGITGVWLSIVLAEFLALFVTIGFLIAKRKKYHYA